ncbi:hypothetical protein R3P38DRAFT_3186487 [Favolaschia claudopus]|uniref:Uncharacterized protein n=1 Tax=Favolaschia claudopus TaxID=2862362 RepID=A0AAW0C1J1_9AGAR
MSAGISGTDLKQISSMIKGIKCDAGKTRPILAAIQDLAIKAGGFVGVCPKPIMFTHDEQKNSPQFSGIPFEPYGSISAFTSFTPPHPVVIALVVCPANPGGITVKQWAAKPMHCNMLVLVSPPKIPGYQSAGKVIVVCEPNITDVEAREHKAKVVLQHRIFSMLQHIKKTSKQIWVNNKRQERNNKGICLQLVLEWMVELVSCGENPLQMSRNDQGKVTAIQGFRSIQM